MDHSEKYRACINTGCKEHPGHPTMGHCWKCVDEANSGIPIGGLFSFRDELPPCCCFDCRKREWLGLEYAEALKRYLENT